MAASYEITSESAEQTLDLGRRIGAALRPGDVVGLSGRLGAGKTLLTRGIAEGMRLDDPSRVASPTFALAMEHAGPLRLHHLDFYRLAAAGDVERLGFAEMCGDGGAVVVEWADRWPGLLPSDSVAITLEPSGETSRKVTIRGDGAAFERIVAALPGLRVVE